MLDRVIGLKRFNTFRKGAQLRRLQVLRDPAAERKPLRDRQVDQTRQNKKSRHSERRRIASQSWKPRSRRTARQQSPRRLSRLSPHYCQTETSGASRRS